MKVFRPICLLLILSLTLALPVAFAGEDGAPLKLVGTIPLPTLGEGDFDHFAKDIEGHRLFLTAEKNGSVEVFDTTSNKLIHTISGLKAPHALLYRPDVKKLFIVDGDDSQVKVYNSTNYRLLGHIPTAVDADSIAYDPESKHLYVVNGGREAKTPYSFITEVDTNKSAKLRDIKIDTNWIEALALEKSGPRMFCVLTGLNAIGVLDRKQGSLTAKWPLPAEDKHPVALGFDELNHRLFVSTRDPGKLVVLNSDAGSVVAELPPAPLIDDLSFDPNRKRLYLAGDGSLFIYHQDDPDHYSLMSKVPTSFRAKTGLLVPEWNRYYLAVPRHAKQQAEVRVYEVQP
jgi:DNA-binding beta-propeller fold protein YncE